MDKLLFLVSAALLGAAALAASFNVKLIMQTPNVTFATAANLMIFPGNLLLQCLLFLTLGLIVRKLNRLLRGARYAELQSDDYQDRY